MRLPRMTTQRWMITVGVIALGLLGWRVLGHLKLAWDYSDLAAMHTRDEEANVKRLRAIEAGLVEIDRSIAHLQARASELVSAKRSEFICHQRLDLAFKVSNLQRFARLRAADLACLREDTAWHSAMRKYYELLERKHRAAARFPWLPVEPDLPPPVPERQLPAARQPRWAGSLGLEPSGRSWFN